MELGSQRRAGQPCSRAECMASATSAAWRAGTFPNGAKQKPTGSQRKNEASRGSSSRTRNGKRSPSTPCGKKSRPGTRGRAGRRGRQALTTQRNAAIQQQDFRKAEIKDAPGSRQRTAVRTGSTLKVGSGACRTGLMMSTLRSGATGRANPAAVGGLDAPDLPPHPGDRRYTIRNTVYGLEKKRPVENASSATGTRCRAIFILESDCISFSTNVLRY